ncbi:HD domain-containing phosphohydrolase [Pseudomonas extremaustralis]|uniref:response regulator n=1 Tax=Pseudomonas extremaustralis TaxID=359110 RepID=UPI002AA94C2C|nr:HD domain-containing phosphohydrolase [Pseudomonas extremaustralis]
MFRDIPADVRIVIIDDVAANLRLLESSLKAFGLREVKSFADSATGLAWLKEQPWDLLLLDLDMPAPDGFEILRQLSGRDRSRSPVIILTALSEPQSRRLGLELGANDYLTKPLDLPELILRMRNALRLSHATGQLQDLNKELEQRVLERTLQLQDSFCAMLRALSRAACYRDDETGDHVLRIGKTACLMAEAIGMPQRWCDLILMAAPMHDLGKIGIPDRILLKEGALTPEERQQMMEHPSIGHAILKDEHSTDLTDMAAEIAYNHHEKWEGGGYPRGLSGEAIPLSARIVALCDVYDALRMDRPYKRAWSPERAQAYILEQSGRHFDPKLVTIMSRCFAAIERLIEEDAAHRAARDRDNLRADPAA